MSNSIKLYTSSTPNGYKVTILLELLGINYETVPIDLSKAEHKSPSFLEMNPNGRIPTLKDEKTNITMGESGAILTYLADYYDKDRKFSYEPGTPEYFKQTEIMYFQAGGLGPMQGQFGHFINFAPEKIPYAINRYKDETKRLCHVLEEFLVRNKDNGPYLVGSHISLADIMCIGWVSLLPAFGFSFEEFPSLEKWVKLMVSIPEVVKGFYVPSKSPYMPKGLLPDE